MRALIFFTGLFTVSITALASAGLDLVGAVYDAKTNQLIYQERHNFSRVDGEEVMRSTFTAPNGDMIGLRTVEYQGDRVRAYRMEQPGLNYKESILRNTEQIKIAGESQGKRESIEVRPGNIQDVVIDAGFSNFIVRNWSQLMEGQTLKFDFASTAQMDLVRLQVRHRETVDEVEMFNMTIANPILRLLLKPIEIGYFADTKQLAYYKGISNLKDDNGEQFSTVRIRYQKHSVEAAGLAD